jgi:hypothetical protein
MGRYATQRVIRLDAAAAVELLHTQQASLSMVRPPTVPLGFRADVGGACHNRLLWPPRVSRLTSRLWRRESRPPTEPLSAPLSPSQSLSVPLSPSQSLSVPLSPSQSLSVPLSPSQSLSAPLSPSQSLSAPLPVSLSSLPWACEASNRPRGGGLLDSPAADFKKIPYRV